MMLSLPPVGKLPIPTPHLPTAHQAFIFRAYEYVTPAKIAAILKTTEENVIRAAEDMGLGAPCKSDVWIKKGYITMLRSLWHILPYDQLLELLEMTEEDLAIVLREEDFLETKLHREKPNCAPVQWRELTEEEAARTREIKKIIQPVDITGAEAFDFKYDVQDMKFSGKEVFGLRMIYGFSSLYQHALDVDSRTYCPDEMLDSYRKTGVNAIWVQGVLAQLSEFPFAPELSKGYEKRLENLRDLIDRCEKFGIQVYLYLNEPRGLPEKFFEKYPEMKGHKLSEQSVCLCTSTKPVQDYLTNNVEFVCRQAPKLGGVFIITRSENLTNCYSSLAPDPCNCPRCKDMSVGEVIANNIACIERGVHRADPNMKVIAWSWAWDEYNLDIIRHLPQNVVLMSQSELHVPYEFGGVKGQVVDYSMGNIGPGERAKAEWKLARERGMEIAAKVQINTSWEGSTVPALPVYPNIEKHIRQVRDEGVTNLLLSWTLGGYPSRNIMHAAKYFYESYDESVFPEVGKRATELFTEALKEFPFHIYSLYFGPQNAGPSNLLYLDPTGYTVSMTCYVFDDMENWRGDYPLEVYENQYAKICSKWKEGLDLLEQEIGTPEQCPSELNVMAHAAYCLYKSGLNQIHFYQARAKQDRQTMLEMAKEELVCTEQMLSLMRMNAAIGFEAANQYYFSKGQLREKILNCHYVMDRLKREMGQ